MEALTGKWKVVGEEGSMSAFLTERGVPLPVRKVLELMSKGGEFEFAIKDNAFCETEIGMIRNTVKPPLPLDGSPQDVTTPSGDPCFTTCVWEDGTLKITETMKADSTDIVNQEIVVDGSTIKRTYTNKKTGTFFTGILNKI